MKLTTVVLLAGAFLSVPLLAQEPLAGTIDTKPQSASTTPAEAAPEPVVLKAGSEVKLQFAQSLSSKHAATGEKVELRVADDVKVGERIVIPKGARVLGTVTQGKKNEKYGNTNLLAVKIDYIVVGNKRIRLTGEQKEKVKTNAGSATAAGLAFGLTGLAFYMSNREAWIREGTPIVGYTAEDTEFVFAEVKPETPTQ